MRKINFYKIRIVMKFYTLALIKPIYIKFHEFTGANLGIISRPALAFLMARAAATHNYSHVNSLAKKIDPNRANAISKLVQLSAHCDDQDWEAAYSEYLGTKIDLELDGNREADRFYRIKTTADPIEATSTVSVIVPVYNAQESIDYAVESLLNQSWRRLQIILIDDQSQDNSYQTLKRLAMQDDRILVLRTPKNLGPYAAKNIALEHVTGTYVTCHDADDIALANRIETQMHSLLNIKNSVANFGHMIRLSANGSIEDFRLISSSSCDGISRLAPVSALFQTKWFKENLGHWDDVRFGADSEILARASLLLGEQFSTQNDVLMLCLDSETSLTKSAQTSATPSLSIRNPRVQYRVNWSLWHQQSHDDRGELYLPCPHRPRKFEAPQKMLNR